MTDWKTEMLEALAEAGEGYLNGARLARRLGCTRSAIWKRMGVLRAEGYPIAAHPNLGYRLNSGAEFFRIKAEAALLERSENSFAIHVADVADSTNRSAKEAAEAGAPDRSVFVALYQREGRGRRGRTWISEPGEGLCFSVLLRPSVVAEATGMLSLLFGLGVSRAIDELYAVPVGIKWPNDIVSLVNGRKLCGILSETSFEDNRLSYAIIGCGMNVTGETFPAELRETATSLRMEGVAEPSAPLILASVLRHFSRIYTEFLDNAVKFLDEYRNNCVTLGREVIIVGSEERIGTALGVNDKGELIVRLADGTDRNVTAGEVSIRGLNGYI